MAKLHVDAVGRISLSPKKTILIFLLKPPTGIEFAALQKINTSSKEHLISPAIFEVIKAYSNMTCIYILSQSSRESPKYTKACSSIALFSLVEYVTVSSSFM